MTKNKTTLSFLRAPHKNKNVQWQKRISKCSGQKKEKKCTQTNKYPTRSTMCEIGFRLPPATSLLLHLGFDEPKRRPDATHLFPLDHI